MFIHRSKNFVLPLVAVLLAVCSLRCMGAAKPTTSPAPTTPRVGDKAADHVLKDVEGKDVRLSDQLKTGPVVVVVLRGWPGYQCPFCTAQFADLLAHADEFAAARASVMLVYPGPARGLREHAVEFRKGGELPANFRLLVDPDYAFSTAHGLRWDAPGETVYPATVVLDREGVIRFARVSHEHGGRVAAKEVIEFLSPSGKADGKRVTE